MRVLRHALAPGNPPRLAVLALLAAALANASVMAAQDVAKLTRGRGPDNPERSITTDPDRYAAELAAIKQMVPANGVLGYVNPALLPSVGPSHTVDLFAIRYALAPLCVSDSRDEPLLLVFDASRDRPDPRWGAEVSYDLGGGFRLYDRTARR